MSEAPLDLPALLAAVRPIAEEAGRATLRFYGLTESVAKADGSPVTAADQAAEDIILPALRALTRTSPWSPRKRPARACRQR